MPGAATIMTHSHLRYKSKFVTTAGIQYENDPICSHKDRLTLDIQEKVCNTILICILKIRIL